MRIRAIAVACLLHGCASVRHGVGDVQYTPIHIQHTREPRQAFSAAVLSLAEMGPTEISSDDVSLRVTALFPEGETRDVVVVQVIGSDASVEFRMEVWDDGTWISGRGTCEGYDYARERAIAELIRRRLDGIK